MIGGNAMLTFDCISQYCAFIPLNQFTLSLGSLGTLTEPDCVLLSVLSSI